MLRTHFFLVWVLLVSACAGLDVRPVPDDEADEKARGFRYYEESPYILVYTDGGPGLTAKLVYLPDTTRKMSASPHQVLSSNKVKLTFSNGTLVESTTDADATKLPMALVEAAKGVALVAASALDSPGEAAGPLPQVPAPLLFKVVVDGAETKLLCADVIDASGAPIMIKVAQPKASQ